MLCIFSLKLLQWLKRGWSITMILYIVSSIILAINLAASLIYTQTSLADYSMTSVVIDYPGNENRLLPASAYTLLYLFHIFYCFILIKLVCVYFLIERILSKIHSLPVLAVCNCSVALLYKSVYTSLSLIVLRQFLTRPFELILAYDVLYTV